MKFFHHGLIIAFVLAITSGCAGAKPYVSKFPSGTSIPSPARVVPLSFSPAVQVVYHTVLPKETLWRISQNYQVPMEAIMRANSLVDKTKLSTGQRLLIPGLQPSRIPIPLFADRGKWKYIVVHHTATDQGDARTIHNLHLKRGWKNGMGYHFIIDNGTLGRPDGGVEIGQRWYRQMNGAHANKSNMNNIGIGISLVGNFSKTDVSEAQLKSLVDVIKTLQRQYKIPNSRVISHRGVNGAATECPGTRFPWNRLENML